MSIACPNCGSLAREGASFCDRCGYDLRSLQNNQSSNIPNTSYNPILDDMNKASELRSRTDRIISPLWILVPLCSLAFTYISLAVFFIAIEQFLAALNSGGTAAGATITTPPEFSYIELLSFALTILFLYLLYTLIKRRNLHFEREYRFFYDLSLILKNILAARGLAANQDVQFNLRYIDSDLTTIHYSEKERSAVLWVILAIIPIINIFAEFYIYYFLMRDYQEHEPMEDLLVSKISKCLGLAGGNFSFSRENAASSSGKIPNRNFWLYLILDIITLGAFQLYWIYTLINDPNKHFQNQIQIENNLISTIKTMQ